MKISVSRDVFQKLNDGQSNIAITRSVIVSTLPDSDVQFHVKRDIKLLNFEVHFNGNGGTSSKSTINGFVGQKIGELPYATRGTWLFNGWYTSPTGGTEVDQNTKISSAIKNLYAHWIEATALTFDPNGGTLSGSTSILAYVGKPLGESGMAFPTATGPEDNPNFVGWYTLPEGGVKLTQDTIYDGTYVTIYPHYATQSYNVELNGQWFKDDGSGVDPNGKSYGTTYSTNPDPNEYDGTYISYSNFNVNSGWAKMRINFVGYSEFVVYIRSYAESNYDYTVIGNLDQNITSNPSSGYDRTYGSQTSGTAISNYKKVIYSNLDGGQHFVDIVFRKDSSVNSNQDRGYVLIPNVVDPLNISKGRIVGLKSYYLSSEIPVNPDISVYNGQDKLLSENVDRRKDLKDNDKIGTAYLSVVGISPYFGKLENTFRIVDEIKYNDKSISNDGIIGNYYSYDDSQFSDTCYSKTISFWAKMNDLTGKGAFVKIGNNCDNGFGFGVATGTDGFEHVGNYLRCLYEGIVWVGAKQVTDLNAWHHYCVVIRQSSGNYNNYIYKDGELFASFNNSSSIKKATTGFSVSGYDCSGYNRCITGKMTRICMWNKQLAEDEIHQDYALGQENPNEYDNSLIHYWDMSLGQNDVLLDKVGNWNLTKHGDSITLSEDIPWI